MSALPDSDLDSDTSATGSHECHKPIILGAHLGGRDLSARIGNVARALCRSRFVAWLILATSAVAVFPATIMGLIDTVNQGEPVGYLLLLPVWLWAIAHRCYVDRRDHQDIADGEIDWIVGAGIAAFVVSCQQLSAPRLADASQLWHFGLIAVTGWCAGCYVVLFGLRALARAWPAWVFLLACFPTLALLVGGEAGGDATTFGILNIAYGSVALYLSVDLDRKYRLALVVASLALGSLVVVALVDSAPLIQEVVPAAVVPTMLYGVSLRWARTERWLVTDHHPKMPGVGPKSLVALITVTIAGSLIVDEGFTGERKSPIVVPANWVQDLALPAPYGWHPGAGYSWAPKSYGPGATMSRYTIDRSATTAAPAAGVAAAVDVLTVAERGRLSSYPSGLLYPVSPPLQRPAEQIRLPSGISALVQYNDTESAQEPNDPLWVMLIWTWKLSDGRYQRVTVLESQYPNRPGLLPTARKPGVVTGVVQPVVWLLQSRRSPQSILLTQAITDVTQIAATVIHSAQATADQSPESNKP